MSWQQDLNDIRLDKGGWYGCIVNDGWKDIVLLTDAMLVHIDPEYKIQQVKEKFGTLRYYYSTQKMYGSIERKIMDAIVDAAEYRSQYVCESCGGMGELRNNKRWLRTLCDDCYKSNKRSKEAK